MMASHHRRKRQQDARVEMEAVEEGKEEEEEDEDEVEKIGFRRVVTAVVVFGTGRSCGKQIACKSGLADKTGSSKHTNLFSL
ncbi:hypothetical protein Droror1_Dr00027238 [Drosera rotundifolia]